MFRAYFSCVWPPFAFYLAVYCLAWLVQFPVDALTDVFRVLHLGHLILFIAFVVISVRSEKPKIAPILFWTIICLVLTLPGAYLEFPADPWVHFVRLMSWQNCDFIHQHESRSRFAYFFGWTFLSGIPISDRRLVLDLLSGFWQIVLCLQFNVLLKALKVEAPARWAGIVGWIFLFGTSIFGMRYYSLSSTPLAMIGMFAGLAVVEQTFFDKKFSRLITLIPLCALMELNHPKQEIVNFALGAVAIAFTHFYLNLGADGKRRVKKGFLYAGIFGLVYGVSMNLISPLWLQELKKDWIIGNWGGPSVKGNIRVMTTLGLHGILGLAAAVFLFRRYPTLCALAWAPIFLFLFPPVSQLMMRAAGPIGSVYRLLYGFPASLPFVLFCFLWLRERTRLRLATQLLLIALIGLPFWKPWFGRLVFQLRPSDPMHALSQLDVTAEWFEANRRAQILEFNCTLLTDTPVSFLLTAHLALPLYDTSRVNSVREIITLSERRDPMEFVERVRACGVLIPRVDRIAPIRAAWVGEESKHWKTEAVDIRTFAPRNGTRLEEILVSNGWTRIEVPPFYYYYEPHVPYPAVRR